MGARRCAVIRSLFQHARRRRSGLESKRPAPPTPPPPPRFLSFRALHLRAAPASSPQHMTCPPPPNIEAKTKNTKALFQSANACQLRSAELIANLLVFMAALSCFQFLEISMPRSVFLGSLALPRVESLGAHELYAGGAHVTEECVLQDMS
jgi:hypothetical protein